MEIINELIEVLSSKIKFDDYFKTDIQSLSRIKENFDKGVIRVGLIGITSSGKSTLINAFLGEQLLPQKVKPSSNILVECSYEKIKKATIFFEDQANNAPEVIFTNIAKSLEKYGDEYNNPGNKYQVKEIRVGTPNFKLSKSISLVDSPGLDAHEMELHEKITLQLALPTLDLVLYLTTVKASSDKENLSRIDEISIEDKPLIVVQNMIDSIEPKIVRGGIVTKGVKEIRDEHYLRLTKLLKRGNKSSTNNATIIQVSSLQALNNKYEESNVEQLFNVITEIEIKLKKRQEYDRVNQLKKKVDGLIKNLSKFEIHSFEEEERNIEILNSEFSKTFISNNFNPNSVIDAFENEKDDIISEINKGIIESEIKKLMNIFLKKKESIEIELSHLIKRTQGDIITFGKKLNITSQDLRIAITNSHNKMVIAIPLIHLSKTNKKTVIENGLSGRFSRFFGKIVGKKDWGYKTIEETEYYNVIDKMTLIDDLNIIFNDWEKWYVNTYNKYNDQRQRGIETIKEDINLKIKSINDKKRDAISNSDKYGLISKLKQISIRLKSKISTESHNFIIDKKETKYISEEEHIYYHSRMIIDMFKLTHNNSYYPLYAIRDFCLDKLRSKSVFIWGWDSNDLISFTNLFFYSTEPVLNDNFFITLNSDVGEISIINENNFDKNKHGSIVRKLADEDATFFINIDLSQSGFIEKKYNESIINEISEKKVIWVIQGLEILLKNDSLIEAIVNFSNYLDRINVLDRLFIISTKDPFYSLLVNELINIVDLKNFLIADERKIITKIGKNREAEVSRYIKQYLDEKRN